MTPELRDGGRDDPGALPPGGALQPGRAMLPTPPRPFTPAMLGARLDVLPRARRYLIAYSGGLDSTVLLHALSLLRWQERVPPLLAVHVHHGLQPEADAWEAHCRARCASLDLPFQCVRVKVDFAPGRSPEAAARSARYRALRAGMEQGDALLTAHHADDQAETLLLQLFRGAGLRGAAGMRPARPFGPGWLLRPLLDFDRAALQAYARQAGLDWIEDPSNRDLSLARNLLRHRWLPMVEARWPKVRVNLARSAALLREADAVLEAFLDAALMGAVDDDDGSLNLPALAGRTPAQQRALLRHWLHRAGVQAPDRAAMARLLDEVIAAAPDARPRLRLGAHDLRRHGGRLHLVPLLAPLDASTVVPWDLGAPLTLPQGNGVLRAVVVRQGGLRADWPADARIEVRYRQGGERCRLPGRAGRRELKKLLQEAGIPPWLRERLPLLYIGDELAAVADLWVCADFAAAPGEPQWALRWDAPLPRPACRDSAGRVDEDKADGSESPA